MPPMKRTIDAGMALHKPELEDLVKQRSHMALHCKTLLELLVVLIGNTYTAAPKRMKNFCLERNPAADKIEKVPERLLERAMWEKWKRTGSEQDTPRFHGTVCSHIQTYQMPLKLKNDVSYWGKVDLVGVSELGLPVVIELKQGATKETPLRMLVEGLAYAVAVRKAWNEGGLRDEWIRAQLPEIDAPKLLNEVPVIGIAPVEYWSRSIGGVGRRMPGKVPEEAWAGFLSLCEACSDLGYPMHFLQLSVGGDTSAVRPPLGVPEPVQVDASVSLP